MLIDCSRLKLCEDYEHSVWLVYYYDYCWYSGTLIHVVVVEAAAVIIVVGLELEMVGIV